MWTVCGDDRLRLDTRHTWWHDRIVHMHMRSGVQRCGLCYRCANDVGSHMRAPCRTRHACEHDWHGSCSMPCSQNACLIDCCTFYQCTLTMDDVMAWNRQQVHALRAMATLRGRSSATRHTAHLAARPDRAHAHVQRGTAVRTVLQVAGAWI